MTTTKSERSDSKDAEIGGNRKMQTNDFGLALTRQMLRSAVVHRFLLSPNALLTGGPLSRSSIPRQILSEPYDGMTLSRNAAMKRPAGGL
jgi:hypothetical protein